MSPKKTAEQLMDEGFELLESYDYEGAIRTGKKLKRMRHSSAFEILATAYAEDGDRPKAIRELEAGVEKAPDVWRLWQQLGNYYSDEKRYDDAKRAYERAVSCPDSYVDSVRLNMAIAMNRANDHEAALEILETIQDDDLRVRVAASTVTVLTDLGRHEAAIAVAERAIAVPSDDPEDVEPMSRVYSGLGEAVWAHERDADLALKHAWKAIELNNGNNGAMWLVREVRNRKSPDSQYFRMIIHGESREQIEDEGETQGFYRSFDVVADTEESALELAKEFESETVRPTITIDECDAIEPAPDSPHGVYTVTGHVFYSEAEDDS